jgi:hypothetical protein
MVAIWKLLTNSSNENKESVVDIAHEWTKTAWEVSYLSQLSMGSRSTVYQTAWMEQKMTPFGRNVMMQKKVHMFIRHGLICAI